MNFYSYSSSEHLVIKPPFGDSAGNLSRSRGEEVILWGKEISVFLYILGKFAKEVYSKKGPFLEMVIIVNASIYLKVVELSLG